MAITLMESNIAIASGGNPQEKNSTTNHHTIMFENNTAAHEANAKALYAAVEEATSQKAFTLGYWMSFRNEMEESVKLEDAAYISLSILTATSEKAWIENDRKKTLEKVAGLILQFGFEARLVSTHDNASTGEQDMYFELIPARG